MALSVLEPDVTPVRRVRPRGESPVLPDVDFDGDDGAEK